MNSTAPCASRSSLCDGAHTVGDDAVPLASCVLPIHRPVQLHVAAEDVVSARNQGAAVARAVEQGEQVRLWLAAVLT